MSSRREFLRQLSLGMAAVAASPLLGENLIRAAERAARVGASDKIRLGVIGCNGMGRANLSDFMLIPEVDCVALCDVDTNILNACADEVVKLRGKKPALFDDYRKMLEMKDIDMVVIATPDHWHCLNLVDACAAGKDVYVEKPIANSIAECDIMAAAVKRYGRVVNVGQQQRSGNHWIEMIDYLNSGKLGQIARVDVWGNFDYGAGGKPRADAPVPPELDYEMWQGPAPARPYNPQHVPGMWRLFWSYGGGLMTDWGVHLLDMGIWGLGLDGMPEKVMSVGGKYAFAENYPETFNTQTVIYDLGDTQMTWMNCAGTETGPWRRHYGIAFRGVNGTLVSDRTNWEIFPEKTGGRSLEAKQVFADGLDHRTHVSRFVECVKSRNMDTPCTIDNGSLAAKYAHLGNIAARTGKILKYNDLRKTFGDREADKYLTPEYRAPWKLPKI